LKRFVEDRHDQKEDPKIESGDCFKEPDKKYSKMSESPVDINLNEQMAVKVTYNDINLNGYSSLIDDGQIVEAPSPKYVSFL